MTKKIDLSGQMFGELIVVRFSESTKQGKSQFLCKCNCGSEKVVMAINLKNGNTKSCGCLGRHGMSGLPEYKIWLNMRDRCRNPKSKEYHRYGERGIKVCERWNSFLNFFYDMGVKTTKGHSIDRIDNDGNYEPSNCRWATAIEQQTNTRKNVFLTYKGKNQTISEWSRDTGIHNSTIGDRIRRGWSVKDALSKPTQTRMEKD